jgi:glutamyl-tRNA reductase
MERICVEGINHRTSELILREKLYVPANMLAETLSGLLKTRGIDECMILSTCNRTDIYYVYSGKDMGTAAMEALCGMKNIDFKKHAAAFYLFRGSRAVEHVFKVASSLDSMVIGENEVTGQFKDAFVAALENKSAGRVLYALFNAAMAAEKRVRNSTDISKGAVSVSHIAVELAAGIFGTLKGKRVLLIGAGRMAQMAAEHFRKKGAGSIDVLNKTYEKAVDMSKEFKGAAYGFGSLKQAMENTDIVLASTGSVKPVIKTKLIRGIAAKRNTPLHIIDIAVPRDTEAGIKNIKGVFVHDMDDLNKHVEKNMAARKSGYKAAEAVIKHATGKFEKMLIMKDLAPVMQGIKEKIYGIVVEESLKTARENKLPLSAARLVEKNAVAVVDRIISTHMNELKKRIDAGGDYESFIKLIKEEFKI